MEDTTKTTEDTKGFMSRIKNSELVQNILKSGFYGRKDIEFGFIDIISYLLIFTVAFTAMYTGYAYTRDTHWFTNVSVTTVLFIIGMLESIAMYFTVSAFYRKRIVLGIGFIIVSFPFVMAGVMTTSFTLVNTISESNATAKKSELLIQKYRNNIDLLKKELTNLDRKKADAMLAYTITANQTLLNNLNGKKLKSSDGSKSVPIDQWQQFCMPEMNNEFSLDPNCSAMKNAVLAKKQELDSEFDGKVAEINKKISMYESGVISNSTNIKYDFNTPINNRMSSVILNDIELGEDNADIKSLSMWMAFAVECSLLLVTINIVMNGRGYPFENTTNSLVSTGFNAVNTGLDIVNNRLQQRKLQSDMARIQQEYKHSLEMQRLQMSHANLQAISSSGGGNVDIFQVDVPYKDHMPDITPNESDVVSMIFGAEPEKEKQVEEKTRIAEILERLGKDKDKENT